MILRVYGGEGKTEKGEPASFFWKEEEKRENMREWLSWWSTTLPRLGSRVRVPSRALYQSDFRGESGFFIIFSYFFCHFCTHFEECDRITRKGGGEYEQSNNHQPRIRQRRP